MQRLAATAVCFDSWWATELAHRIGKPLVKRQASDLLSAYIGETEKLIARAFEEASDLGGVLLIDEADSFLGNRMAAQQSWQVSLINQFLMSMEHHDGLFIATTNLMDNLDHAAMRRFDFRVRFQPLTTMQAEKLLRSLCVRLGLLADDGDLPLGALDKLKELTPGDFAALERRLELEQPAESIADLLARLQQDVSYKQPASRSLGFVH